MDIGKFTLKGDAAFFKKPEVNSYLYVTYGNVHKVALLGMFGAILGYGGYSKMKQELLSEKNEQPYPEFYEKLKDINVSILPNHKKGFIPKKIQSFNNSVGYASQEQGGNLIVKEQWLEKPSWDIYILLDCKESRKVFKEISERRAVFIPYLGKNDHVATIVDIELLSGEDFNLDIGKIHSLFPKKNIELLIDYDLDDDDDDNVYVEEFKYEEHLPYELDRESNAYILQPFAFTNMYMDLSKISEIYKVGEKNIAFF